MNNNYRILIKILSIIFSLNLIESKPFLYDFLAALPILESHKYGGLDTSRHRDQDFMDMGIL